MTKKRVGNHWETKGSKKYGCVCTCCHADDLPRYQCVIFLSNNYNFDIPAVANALSKRYREIRQKEFICKPCHKQLKEDVHTATMSKIVVILICLGQISLMKKMIKTQYTEVETYIESNMTCDFPAQYMTQTTTLTNYCLCTCCHKTDIPRS